MSLPFLSLFLQYLNNIRNFYKNLFLQFFCLLCITYTWKNIVHSNLYVIAVMLLVSLVMYYSKRNMTSKTFYLLINSTNRSGTSTNLHTGFPLRLLSRDAPFFSFVNLDCECSTWSLRTWKPLVKSWHYVIKVNKSKDDKTYKQAASTRQWRNDRYPTISIILQE